MEIGVHQRRYPNGSMITGQIFSVQRYSIHDGPGIRTTVFLKGCPLSCSWCHNPESWNVEPEVWLLPSYCIRCGACLEVCPQVRISVAPGDQGRTSAVKSPLDEPPRMDVERCVCCGACVAACPTGARRHVGRTVGVPELLAEIGRDRPFFEQSGGGVTFSGGEPLSQYEFLHGMLRGCRQQNWHTAVDTSGYAPREQLLDLVGSTDLFLYDLKVMDDSRHREQTGVPVRAILENLVALDATGAEIWIRIPIIPGVNDDWENLDAIGRFVSDLTHTRRVHLLPYHAAGKDKRLRLGQQAEPHDITPPVPESSRAIAERLANFGLDIRLEG